MREKISVNIDIIDEILSESNKENIKEYFYNIFGFDEKGFPNVVDGEILYKANKLIKNHFPELEYEIMTKRFYKNSNDRYEKYIKINMSNIHAGEFMMGSNEGENMVYCGETPKHKVRIDSFLVSNILITNKLYKLYNPFYEFQGNSNKPATNINWYDAQMFCKWFGVRLLTEAEWEYISIGNSNLPWDCEEKELINYAWYSENSEGEIKEVAKKKANSNNLFDLFGNVWEWCEDSYDENFYSKSPENNPVNKEESSLKVCRGGSVHSFSELCRGALRYYEKANYKAKDIGFRIAKSI